jgi:hypothetical protein
MFAPDFEITTYNFGAFAHATQAPMAWSAVAVKNGPLVRPLPARAARTLFEIPCLLITHESLPVVNPLARMSRPNGRSSDQFLTTEG